MSTKVTKKKVVKSDSTKIATKKKVVKSDVAKKVIKKKVVKSDATKIATKKKVVKSDAAKKVIKKKVVKSDAAKKVIKKKVVKSDMDGGDISTVAKVGQAFGLFKSANQESNERIKKKMATNAINKKNLIAAIKKLNYDKFKSTFITDDLLNKMFNNDLQALLNLMNDYGILKEYIEKPKCQTTFGFVKHCTQQRAQLQHINMVIGDFLKNSKISISTKYNDMKKSISENFKTKMLSRINEFKCSRIGNGCSVTSRYQGFFYTFSKDEYNKIYHDIVSKYYSDSKLSYFADSTSFEVLFKDHERFNS
jgi:hypothetical protein